MRLGTVFLGEAATDNGEIQALLRTGALQGKRYEWNATLPPDMAESIRTAINTAYSGLSKSKTVQVDVPMDVLQNKAIKNSISNKGDESIKAQFAEWFKKGGIVMYPLFLVAFFALLLAAERFVVLMYRGHLGKRFMKRLNMLVHGERYEEAANLCLQRGTSLSMVLFAVLNKANDTREAAERSLQEALLREQPKLERRMGLLAAMGTIAPLLGLLGTVTGMVSTFEVITLYGNQNPVLMADGISEALISTQSGLLVAFPLTLLKQRLDERVEILTQELQLGATIIDNYFVG
jgi:biopolymer transport protein ExbB